MAHADYMSGIFRHEYLKDANTNQIKTEVLFNDNEYIQGLLVHLTLAFFSAQCATQNKNPKQINKINMSTNSKMTQAKVLYEFVIID